MGTNTCDVRIHEVECGDKAPQVYPNEENDRDVLSNIMLNSKRHATVGLYDVEPLAGIDWINKAPWAVEV